jgi:hypothetical protein
MHSDIVIAACTHTQAYIIQIPFSCQNTEIYLADTNKNAGHGRRADEEIEFEALSHQYFMPITLIRKMPAA